MKRIIQSIGCLPLYPALSIALPFGTASLSQVGISPVKVFILAGQSNMEGKGSIAHLQQLVRDPAKK